MPASEHLHPELFHGTYNPNWRNNPSWIHAGSRDAAKTRLEEGFYDEHKGNPEIHSISLKESATIYPKVIPHREVAETFEDEEGNEFQDYTKRDLGMLMDTNMVSLQHPSYSHPSGKPYDVYPYENIVEGGTSYVVNPSAIKSSKRVK